METRLMLYRKSSEPEEDPLFRFQNRYIPGKLFSKLHHGPPSWKFSLQIEPFHHSFSRRLHTHHESFWGFCFHLNLFYSHTPSLYVGENRGVKNMPDQREGVSYTVSVIP